MVTVNTGCGVSSRRGEGRKLVCWWLLCLDQGCFETRLEDKGNSKP